MNSSVLKHVAYMLGVAAYMCEIIIIVLLNGKRSVGEEYKAMTLMSVDDGQRIRNHDIDQHFLSGKNQSIAFILWRGRWLFYLSTMRGEAAGQEGREVRSGSWRAARSAPMPASLSGGRRQHRRVLSWRAAWWPPRRCRGAPCWRPRGPLARR